MLVRSLFVLFGMLVLAGCSTVKTRALTDTDNVSFVGKSVALTRYSELPDFPAQTAANVQFGLLGVAAAISSGNAMIEKNKIVDPAIAISDRLAATIRETHGLERFEVGSPLPLKADVNMLVNAPAYKEHDYVLDVKTLGWNSIYFTSDWNNYRVLYSAHARIIDVASGEVIAETLCNHLPEYENTDDAPSYEELKDGTGLRLALEQAVEFCVGHIWTASGLAALPANGNVAVAAQ